MREHPLYHLIKARILKKQGDVAEAAKTLQIAMQLPGVKNSGKINDLHDLCLNNGSFKRENILDFSV